ncbi:MAG: hypothetical protein ACJ8R9_06075 [Steroidobacteraceae bacterium]
MNKRRYITSRRTVLTGLASFGGLLASGCSKTLPPTYGNVLRMGDLLTYKAHRLLLPAHSLAKEYAHADISSIPAIGNTNPADPQQSTFNSARGPSYERLRAGGFTDWRLSIEGRVSRPGGYSLADLKRFPSRTGQDRLLAERVVVVCGYLTARSTAYSPADSSPRKPVTDPCRIDK